MRDRLVALGVAASLALVACGGGGSGDDGGDTAVACPADALAKVSEPVEITFWHTQQRANLTELERQVAAFEASQDKVRVKLVNQTDYRSLFDKYKAGLTTGDLPELAQFEETTVQQLMDSQSTVAVGDCAKADGYGLSDFLPRAVDYYTVDGKLRSMPWTVSNPILLFDPGKLRAAGLDPEDPPRTFEELKEASEKIVASGVATHGMSLRTQDWFNEFFYAKSGQAYVNHDGGRDGRATAATLDNATGRKVWTWWKDMVDSGLALNTGAGENFDELLAIPAGEAAMTIAASGVIGPINEVLSSGQYPGVTIAGAPLPSLTGKGGVPVGDASLWITAKGKRPVERAAAWALVKFLAEPEQIAGFAVASGYVPIRESAANSAQVQEFWAQNPTYRVAYDQLLAPGGPPANGSVIGNYQGVRDAVRDALIAMLTEGKSVNEALAQAQRDADEAIQSYNARVG